MRVHPLVAAVGTLCTAYFALWACAPAAMLRPPTPMVEGDPNELGVGAMYNVAIEDTGVLLAQDYAVGPGAQIWYSYHFSDKFSMGAVAFGGAPSLLGVGLQARYLPVTNDKIRLGVDLAGGALWGEVGLPFAARLSDRLWLYGAPSVGARTSQMFRFPVGLSIGIGDHVQITPEISAGYGNTPFLYGEGNRGFQLYGAVGSTFRV